ncbi:RNA-directed DNA polymerase from mobile element jockey [Plakobranchus ocellatus]|uniref:RNA-directed DNA polymerase from mobile element jockey n=1 Tax=Plakobranchus ocellatus TaxID=259542 RepID=A0AAV4BQ61_9GAST|nr:RNA-directed DNA polymerase from mobile element jockey [Plakobranchus ocellatus]
MGSSLDTPCGARGRIGSTVVAAGRKRRPRQVVAYGLPLGWTSSRVALTQRWSTAQRVPLVGLRGGRGALELNLKTIPMTKSKNTPNPSSLPDVAKKPCTEAARGAVSVASKRKAEDLPTLMSVSPFAGWSPFKKFMVISSKGSAKVADRSPFKIHRELKSILGDETIEVTKLGSGDLMVELKSNDQAKKLGAIATFLDIPVTVSHHKSLNSSKGMIRSHDLRCCSEEEMVEELSGVTHARRIKVRRDEDKIQTDTVVLTFDSPKPRSRIRAGYLTLDVRPYVPLPMRYYKCQRYGHGKDRSDWNRFGDLCKLSLDDSVADIEQFTAKLLDATRSSIPFHKGTKNKTCVRWFTQECRQALRERKKAQRKYFKTPSFENFVNFKKTKGQG